MSNGVTKFFVGRHREVGRLPGNTSKCCHFWGVNDTSDQRRVTIPYVADVIGKPSSSLRYDLERI